MKKILAGSYPSGPSSTEPPLIWQMITNNEIPAYNIPSGILFDMHREAAARRLGVLTKVGLDTFVDPKRQGTAMNEKAREAPVIKRVSIQKAIARRVVQELQAGSVVNLGFGISANVPRILLEEGLHGAVTWVIEQGAVGGVPLLDFAFGCASNADAYMPTPYQFNYFQGAGFDASLLSFLEIGRDGSVNVSKLSFCPHVTAGAGGFVDITARAKKIVFSGMFNAGAKLSVTDGKLVIEKEGKLKKLVNEVEHVTFSSPRGVEQGQDITYVTERAVMKLPPAVFSWERNEKYRPAG